MIWYPKEEIVMQNMFTILNNTTATTMGNTRQRQQKTRHTSEYTVAASHDYFDNE